jgi:hypothetical protein
MVVNNGFGLFVKWASLWQGSFEGIQGSLDCRDIQSLFFGPIEQFLDPGQSLLGAIV